MDRDRLRLRAIVVSTNDALRHELSQGVKRRIRLEADRLLNELERDVRAGRSDGTLLEDITRARTLIRPR
jgi:hypothetical protein